MDTLVHRLSFKQHLGRDKRSSYGMENVEAYHEPCTSEEYLRSRAGCRPLPLALQLATSANFYRRERVLLVLLSFGVSSLLLCLYVGLLCPSWPPFSPSSALARGKSFPSSLGLLDDLEEVSVGGRSERRHVDGDEDGAERRKR